MSSSADRLAAVVIQEVRAALAAPDLTLTPFWHTRVLTLVDVVEQMQRERDEAKSDWQTALSTLGEKIVQLEKALLRIGGNDPNGFEGYHHVGDEKDREDCPGCIAQAALAGVPAEPAAEEKLPQVACDRCSQGVMDATNPHLVGGCSCECHAASSVSAEPATEERPTEGLPSDLARILRDPTITFQRDHEIRLADGRTLFEHLHEWRNAPSNTASAHIDPAASSVSAGAGQDCRDVLRRLQRILSTSDALEANATALSLVNDYLARSSAGAGQVPAEERPRSVFEWLPGVPDSATEPGDYV